MPSMQTTNHTPVNGTPIMETSAPKKVQEQVKDESSLSFAARLLSGSASAPTREDGMRPTDWLVIGLLVALAVASLIGMLTSS